MASKLLPRLGGYICPYRTTTAEDEAWIETVECKVNSLDRDKTMTKFSAFLKDEAGAVTVDWVVLTAAIVGLGLLVFTFLLIIPVLMRSAEQFIARIRRGVHQMSARAPNHN